MKTLWTTQFNLAYGTYSGGVETYVKYADICGLCTNILVTRDANVDLNDKKYIVLDCDSVRTQNSKGISNRSAYTNIRNAIENLKIDFKVYDLIIINDLKLTYNRRLYDLSNTQKVLNIMHGTFTYFDVQPLYQLLREYPNLLYANATYNSLRQLFDLGVQRDKGFYLPAVYDKTASCFNPVGNGKFVNTCRINPDRRVYELIELFQHTDHQLDIIGLDESKIDEYAEKCLSLASKLPNVRILNKLPVHQCIKEKAKYSAYINITLGWFYGCEFGAYEALLCGVPVFSDEYLGHSYNGYSEIVKPNCGKIIDMMPTYRKRINKIEYIAEQLNSIDLNQYDRKYIYDTYNNIDYVEQFKHYLEAIK